MLQILDFNLEGAPGHGVQSTEGLIHQDNGRGGGQRPEDADALLLPTRHLRGILVGILVKGHIDHFQQVMDYLITLLLGPFQQFGHHTDVLCDGHVGEQTDLLYDIACVTAEFYPVHGTDILVI